MSLFGSGGMFDILQQVQQMGPKLKEVQEKLTMMEFTETSEDGKIVVVCNGKGEVKSITIAPELIHNHDPKFMEEKLIPVLNRTYDKVKKAALKELAAAAGPFGSMLSNLPI